jgi:hypothetical protein
MFLHKNALSQKRSEYRPLGWKNFGECSIRLRWGSQNLGSFLLDLNDFSIRKYMFIMRQEMIQVLIKRGLSIERS